MKSSRASTAPAWEDRPRLSREDEDRFFAGAREATRFFMGESDVQRAAHEIAHLLEESRIAYAFIGGIALNEYGYSHMTTDIDVLLNREGFKSFIAVHPELTENGVPIDVVLAGDYPGDGLPKPVAFPDPANAAVRGERTALLPLPRLIELKLASGMTAPHRLKDLADVIEIVRILKLPAEMAGELDPYVREKFQELWRAAQIEERE
jgi:hypothetical protein